MVGYATVYTMLPRVLLGSGQGRTGQIAMTYPELYKELTKAALTYKTFIWCLVSIYQGRSDNVRCAALFEDEFIHIVANQFHGADTLRS